MEEIKYQKVMLMLNVNSNEYLFGCELFSEGFYNCCGSKAEDQAECYGNWKSWKCFSGDSQQQ